MAAQGFFAAQGLQGLQADLAAQGFFAAHGFLAEQGFLAAQGLQAHFFVAQGFFMAQGFLATHGFLAAQGFFMAQGLAILHGCFILHGWHICFAEHGLQAALQGRQVLATAQPPTPKTAANTLADTLPCTHFVEKDVLCFIAIISGKFFDTLIETIPLFVITRACPSSFLEFLFFTFSVFIL